MNLPNRLTILRIIMVPFVLLFMLPLNFPESAGWDHFVRGCGMLIALVIFIAAAITDYFDGHVARSRSIVSNFGKFLDPIADKLLVLSVFMALVERGRISAVIAIIVMFREFLVTGVRLLAAEHNQVIAANMWGKVKTVTQIIAIILIMLEMSLRGFGLDSLPVDILMHAGNAMIAISLIMTILSGAIYLKDNAGLLTHGR